MSEVIIYHNPRCAKSRQTLELLQSRGIEPTIVEYILNPPTISEIQHILKLLSMQPHDLMRTNEAEYKDNKLNPAMSDDKLIRAMIIHPKLIQRPIVLANGKAEIGRPPEMVLEIL